MLLEGAAWFCCVVYWDIRGEAATTTRNENLIARKRKRTKKRKKKDPIRVTGLESNVVNMNIALRQ